MTVLSLLWHRPWNKAKRAQLFHRDVRSWGLIVLLGHSLVLMNALFYATISDMDVSIAVSIEFLGPLSVAVTTDKSQHKRVGIGITAVGVVLLTDISLANPSGNGMFLYGLITVLISGSMWDMYIIIGRRVATDDNPLDNLCIVVTINWLVQSLFLGVPAVAHVVHLKADAAWALEPGGLLELLALLFMISLMASFVPYVVEWITLRRTASGVFSIIQSINPVTMVTVRLVSDEIPSVGEIVDVALVTCAVIVTFSGDTASADVQ